MTFKKEMLDKLKDNVEVIRKMMKWDDEFTIKNFGIKRDVCIDNMLNALICDIEKL